MGWGLLPDDSGMTPAEKRAALLVIQGNACAVCGAADPAHADHDHQTGLLRGMLCASCNATEGRARSRFFRVSPEVAERFNAYRAQPPAGKAWFWEFPDDWLPSDTAAVRDLGMTILDYVLTARPERVAAACETLETERIATMQQRRWTEPGR